MAPQLQTVEPKRGVRTVGLFPGQGSQYPGMGWRLFSESAAAREMMARAEEALGLRFSRTMFDGTEEELRRTENASAAIFVDSLMAFRAFRDAGGEVDAVSAIRWGSTRPSARRASSGSRRGSAWSAGAASSWPAPRNTRRG